MGNPIIYKVRSLPKLILKYIVQYWVLDQLPPFFIYITRRVRVSSNHDPDNVATLESLFIGPLRLLWSSRVPFLAALKIGRSFFSTSSSFESRRSRRRCFKSQGFPLSGQFSQLFLFLVSPGSFECACPTRGCSICILLITPSSRFLIKSPGFLGRNILIRRISVVILHVYQNMY